MAEKKSHQSQFFVFIFLTSRNGLSYFDILFQMQNISKPMHEMMDVQVKN